MIPGALVMYRPLGGRAKNRKRGRLIRVRPDGYAEILDARHGYVVLADASTMREARR